MRVFLNGHFFSEWEGSLDDFLSMMHAMGDTGVTLEQLSWDPEEFLAFKTAEALQQLSDLRSLADQTIAPLQDASDVGEATAEEEAMLAAWKKYRIDLSRVPKQPGYPAEVEWPAPPA
ncbi:tail fiber assembly protein [Pseudomonas sp. AP-1]|uniref:tail fiber assembly protein n=1 Tax=Pseudomonas sp. AP-1 TaxID=3231718 RepID=UPI0035B0588B